MQKLKKLKQKMGFLVLAKHGLNKTWDLRQIWSHFGRPKTWRRRGEEEKREEEEEEEEKKKRGEEEKPISKVWNY